MSRHVALALSHVVSRAPALSSRVMSARASCIASRCGIAWHHAALVLASHHVASRHAAPVLASCRITLRWCWRRVMLL